MAFAQATATKQIDATTYEVDFSPAWVIGSVPHGGYVTSCIMTAVRKHFDTTLRKQNQPHTLALHLDFLRRTETGRATITIKQIKLGRQTSVVHVALNQGDREEVVGYITNSNLHTESGLSFPTTWVLQPKPPLVSDFSTLLAGKDPNWGERKEWPFSDFRKASQRVRTWFPRKGQPSRSCVDMWATFPEPESKFTNESLGYLCDFFPQILESYVVGFDIYGLEFERDNSPKEQRRIINESGFSSMWYPTLLLNLEVKKALPEEGVDWMFSRLQAKRIRNGRYDLELVLFDAEGDLVAISNHVVYAVGSERNTAQRRKVEKEGAKL